MDQQTQLLDAITKYLLTLNTAAPIIFGVITTIGSIFKGLTGTGLTLREYADLIERNLDANDTAIRAEIARLKALLAP